MKHIWIDWHKDRVEDVFIEERFAGFKRFCDTNNIVYTFQLKGYDFFSLCNIGGFEFSDVVAIIERWNDYVGQVMDIMVPVPSGEILSLAGDAHLMYVENKSIKVDEQTRQLVVAAKDLIVQVFQDSTYLLFRNYCQKNNMTFMKDLLDFDYDVLLNINGFGKKKLRLVKDKWLWYLNSLKERRLEIDRRINTETSKEVVETITGWGKTVKPLSFHVERDLVWRAVSEIIGEEMMQLVFGEEHLKKERMRSTERIKEALSAFIGNQDVQLIDEYALAVLKETLKRISILHIGDDIPRLIKERGLAKFRIVDIVNMLQDFIANVEEINQVIDVLQDASKKVHPDNFPLGVTCLKTVGVSDDVFAKLKVYQF